MTEFQIHIKEHAKPKMKRPIMKCDVELHPRLRAFPMLDDFMNTANTTMFLGGQGMGKTSLLVSLIDKPLRGIYDKVFFWMPQSSRNSLKTNIFNRIPDNQLFEELTEDNLSSVYDFINDDVQKERDDDEGSKQYLLVMDDVQNYLKDKRIVFLLKRIISNQRHLHCTIFLLCQNYKAMDNKMRNLIHNIFVFKLAKPEMEYVFNEIWEGNTELFDKVMDMSFGHEAHTWLMINRRTQRIFKMFDEIVYKDSYPERPPRTLRKTEEK